MPINMSKMIDFQINMNEIHAGLWGHFVGEDKS